MPYVAPSKPLMSDHMPHASFIKVTGRWCSSHEQKDDGIVSSESKKSLVPNRLSVLRVNDKGHLFKGSWWVTILRVINRLHVLQKTCIVTHKPDLPIHGTPKFPAVSCLLRHKHTAAYSDFILNTRQKKKTCSYEKC